jgi:hypothetical protein
VILRCWIKGSGASSHIDATVRPAKWAALDARNRQVEAERLAKSLQGRNITSALVKDNHGGSVIVIDKGFVSYVQGGKI